MQGAERERDAGKNTHTHTRRSTHTPRTRTQELPSDPLGRQAISGGSVCRCVQVCAGVCVYGVYISFAQRGVIKSFVTIYSGRFHIYYSG